MYVPLHDPTPVFIGHRGAVLGEHRFCEDSEWQAKALTAALMMPASLCQEARSAHELAQLCGTSTQAARYRLSKLVERKVIAPKLEIGLFDT